MSDYLLDDIRDHLITQSVCTSSNAFKGFMPHSPDTAFAFFEYAGGPPDKVADIESPQLQVRVRGTDYNSAKGNILAVYAKLHLLWETTINSNRYLYIYANGSPAFLRRDANGRCEFVQNYTVIREND